MPTIDLTDEERAVLINVFAQHWAKAEVFRRTASTHHPRSILLGLDTLFEKLTGRAPPVEIPRDLIFDESGRPKEMAEISAGAFVMKVAHGLPIEETQNSA